MHQITETRRAASPQAGYRNCSLCSRREFSFSDFLSIPTGSHLSRISKAPHLCRERPGFPGALTGIRPKPAAARHCPAGLTAPQPRRITTLSISRATCSNPNRPFSKICVGQLSTKLLAHIPSLFPLWAALSDSSPLQSGANGCPYGRQTHFSLVLVSRKTHKKSFLLS